ncbi:MAG TPA: glycoside hydrolase family 38 C-terminal domain-containing protein [Puia sp.]|nr:glycoside hydrolase family 38 C-terminal domain-containing protein [Puia sp.]
MTTHFIKIFRSGKLLKLALLPVLILFEGECPGQQALAQSPQPAYFIDGYHGGIYGHLPAWQTKFMVEKLAQYPDWKINLELEPESWDTIALQDPVSYNAFSQLFADQSSKGRIEYVNPAYGQSYLYNISGESIIRQFYYGMKKLRRHFPSAVFTTYSSEEPCFTSALPQILRSYGFKYASLKNPNTCWGGYTRAFGGELVNWIGPDGSSILTVPRYEMEALKPHSIWETIACANSREYVQKAFQSGIRHPVGMCLQDAGWAFGPWLRGANDSQNIYAPTIYETWRGYVENSSSRKADKDWRFSQEDVLVGLMWGSQILQRIAREVRVSENTIIRAEKMAALARIWQGAPWPEAAFEAAWRTLLLSQHHDCWIVPYNGKPGNTWADKVVTWTGYTNACSDSITEAAVRQLSGSGADSPSIRVFNTTAINRKEYVRVALPAGWEQASIIDGRGAKVPGQTLSSKEILFKAQVPSMGYSTYRLQKGGTARAVPAISPAAVAVSVETPGVPAGATVTRLSNGQYQIETDLYRILVDPAKGGVITSWLAKKFGGKEFVEEGKSFNELRGNFYNAGGFRSSTETAAEIHILANGPAEVQLEIRGAIAGSPFTQVLTLQEGQPRVDLHLTIDWKGNPAIGEYFELPKNDQVRKAYYDDRYKLLALFPLRLASQKVFKNAPFDVTESRLSNTFYNRWDSIKNNVLLNWVDVEDSAGKYGMALLCDHTTSYGHGEDFPLALTVQYSGNGIFYRDYRVDGPSEMNYAWIPHKGRWDRAGIWTEGTKFNAPMLARITDKAGAGERSLLQPEQAGMEISSLTFEGDELLIRLFNAEAGSAEQKLYLGFAAVTAAEVGLDGRRVKELPIRKDRSGRRFVELSIPRFGIRTLRFEQTRLK